MRSFEDRKDVEEWLEPLNYDEFWREISTFNVAVQSKEHCDAQIAQGIIDEGTVLYVLKGMVRLQIVQEQKLPPRFTVTEMAMH